MLTVSSEPPMDSAAPPAPTVFRVAMTALALLALPLIVYYIWICLQFFGGKLVAPRLELARHFPMPTLASVAIAGGWLLFQGALQVAAPGPWVEGTRLLDGSRLPYKMNGRFSFWFTWACLGAGVASGWIRPAILVDELGPLLTTMNLFAYALSIYLYRLGRALGARGERLTGSQIADFWLGLVRNPRVGSFDIKLFCEARPGLIGWVAIDLSLAAKQYEKLGTITAAMILICAFHFWYVADYYRHEEAILTTWDVRHENFGFMLCWGNLVWVPFTYTIQAFYLVNHSPPLGSLAIAGLVLLNFAGFVIFRGTNIQKHRFRKDPERPVWGRPARYIQTARGPLLLASGWWGLARHMNYLGDWLMGLAWCLTTGFSSALPYSYIVFLTILLVHRERRDHDQCAASYGEDWKSYCRSVRWRIVPGIY
jgi:protein-S-isoprenylcysteine O-methyltransferase Ste14